MEFLTSVINEDGQILISVLTPNEGSGLDLMAEGLMSRYQNAGKEPPVVLYVDCNCCKFEGKTKLQQRFSKWPNLLIRLDIWHFMNRFAKGCKKSHELYNYFMSCLSSCIFKTDKKDLDLLRKAKKHKLNDTSLTDTDIDKHLTKEEKKRYCKKKTRGEEVTIQKIGKLLTMIDTYCVKNPLFDKKK